MLAKATFSIRFEQAGYSFSLFQNADGLAAVLTKAEKLGAQVMRLMGTEVEMPSIRVSDEGVSGDSLLGEPRFETVKKAPDAPVNAAIPATTRPIKGAAEGLPDMPFTAALVSLISSSTNKGRIFLRLIPDKVTINPLGIVAPKVWNDAFKEFKETLKEDTWGFQSLKRGGAFVPKKITNVEYPANANVIVTVAAHGYAAGNTVRIGRVVNTEKDTPNGLWTVATVLDANSFTLALSTGKAGLHYLKGGYARKIEKDFFPINDAKIIRVTRRAAGIPFGVSRGRRRVKR